MADSATYTLSILLRLNDQLSGRLSKSVSALRGFRKEADSALKSYSALRKEMGRNVSVSSLSKFGSKVKSVRADAKGLSSEASKLATNLSKPVSTAGLDAATKSARALSTALRGANANRPQGVGARSGGRTPPPAQPTVPAAPGGRRRRPAHRAGLFDRAEELETAMQAPAQIMGAVRERVDSLEKYTEAYLELAQAKAKFAAINLSEEDNRKAFGAVDQTVKSIRGLTQAGTMETLTDLHTALGNLDHAIEALPVASRYRFGIETLFGGKFSKEEVDAQIQSGFKFLEMVGAVRATGAMDEHGKRAFTHDDQSRMEEYFNRVSQITTATGGRVTPAEMLAMARTGGMSLQGLTTEGLAHLVAPMTELGGSRTGTALQAMYQAMVGGTMPQHMIGNWDKLGLVDHTKVEFNKSGIPKRLEPGAIPIGNLLQKDPLAFADALRDAM
ncbi:MAG: hypothetical protein ACJ741_21545, partial [Pyrinomonadaceae bacterium]